MEFNLGLDQDLINAVSQIVEASCSSKKMEKEELHPNQVKLDKNKNGKLDSDDFKKLRKEDAEELDELSKKTLGSYVRKASIDTVDAVHGERDAESDEDHAAQEYHARRVQNRMSGLERVGKKLAKEEVEELDELSKGTLGSYVKKAGQHRVNLAGKEKELGDTVNGLQKAKNNMDDDNYSKVSDVQDIVSKQRNAVSDKGVARARGIHTAIKKLTKEQVEEIEALAAKHGLGE